MPCCRIVWSSSLCLQRLLRIGQGKPLKNKGSPTTFTSKQVKELSGIVKLSPYGFGLELNGDPI